MRKRASVEAAFAEAAAHVGGFDILIANAGVSTMQHALELTDEDWDFNFDVNARGIFLANQIAARHFVAQGSGGIVNTASLAAKVGAPLLAHYSASKFAVLGWTQALARELAPRGIRVNAVCPGFVKTGMQAREIDWEAHLRDVPRSASSTSMSPRRRSDGWRRRRTSPTSSCSCAPTGALHDRPGRQRHRRRLYDVRPGTMGETRSESAYLNAERRPVACADRAADKDAAIPVDPDRLAARRESRHSVKLWPSATALAHAHRRPPFDPRPRPCRANAGTSAPARCHFPICGAFVGRVWPIGW